MILSIRHLNTTNLYPDDDHWWAPLWNRGENFLPDRVLSLEVVYNVCDASSIQFELAADDTAAAKARIGDLVVWMDDASDGAMVFLVSKIEHRDEESGGKVFIRGEDFFAHCLKRATAQHEFGYNEFITTGGDLVTKVLDFALGFPQGRSGALPPFSEREQVFGVSWAVDDIGVGYAFPVEWPTQCGQKGLDWWTPIKAGDCVWDWWKDNCDGAKMSWQVYYAIGGDDGGGTYEDGVQSIAMRIYLNPWNRLGYNIRMDMGVIPHTIRFAGPERGAHAHVLSKQLGTATKIDTTYELTPSSFLCDSTGEYYYYGGNKDNKYDLRYSGLFGNYRRLDKAAGKGDNLDARAIWDNKTESLLPFLKNWVPCNLDWVGDGAKAVVAPSSPRGSLLLAHSDGRLPTMIWINVYSYEACCQLTGAVKEMCYLERVANPQFGAGKDWYWISQEDIVESGAYRVWKVTMMCPTGFVIGYRGADDGTDVLRLPRGWMIAGLEGWMFRKYVERARTTYSTKAEVEVPLETAEQIHPGQLAAVAGEIRLVQSKTIVWDGATKSVDLELVETEEPVVSVS